MSGEMMSHAKTIVETTRGYLGLGVDVGKTALRAVYVPTEKLTEERFANWIGDALVGQSIQYHEGFLLLDRSESSSGLAAKERIRLHSIARRAWIACELGLVHLFSLKLADGNYRYIAIRSGSKLTPPEIRNRIRKAGTPNPVATPETTH
jgi:hypothetical protein